MNVLVLLSCLIIVIILQVKRLCVCKFALGFVLMLNQIFTLFFGGGFNIKLCMFFQLHIQLYLNNPELLYFYFSSECYVIQFFYICLHYLDFYALQCPFNDSQLFKYNDFHFTQYLISQRSFVKLLLNAIFTTFFIRSELMTSL